MARIQARNQVQVARQPTLPYQDWTSIYDQATQQLCSEVGGTTISSSFVHPHHQLHLVVQELRNHRDDNYKCNICGERVEGLFYQCMDCNFDVHPLCTRLQSHVSHSLDPHHGLYLQQSPPDTCCVVCARACDFWCYGCHFCQIIIHIECVLVNPALLMEGGSASAPPPQSPGSLASAPPLPSYFAGDRPTRHVGRGAESIVLPCNAADYNCGDRAVVVYNMYYNDCIFNRSEGSSNGNASTSRRSTLLKGAVGILSGILANVAAAAILM